MVEPFSAEYKALVKKRNTYRKIVASSVNFIKKFDTKSKSCRQVKLRLDEIVKTMGNYDEVQTKIEEIDERPDVQDNERISFLDECNEVRALMLDIIDEYEKSDMNNGRNSTELSSTSRDGGFVKLPAFPIPIFNGSLQDWPSFIDTFNAMFHENDNVPTVQKFQYLKSCLVESAADIVKTIPTTADNYMQAYEAVVSRYENKTLIVQSHIRSLFDTPKVEKASAFNLRQLYHHVTSHVRSLKALGQPTQHWDAWLVTLVCSRLDNVTVGEWQLRQSSQELPRYSDIENYLAMRVAAFEAGEAANQQVLPVDKNNKLRQFGTGPNKVTEKRSLFTKSNDYVKCFICGEDHQINHCDEFLSMKIEDRKSAVFKFKLCYNCLRRNHQVRQCRSSSCTTCGKKHNNLLHQEFQNYATSKPSTSREVDQPATPQSAFVGITNTSLFIQSHTMVMLATVVVEVCDDSGKMVQCRAVLDSGSQVNFVTNQCARRLGLFRVDASVPVTGIGHSHAKSLQYCAAQVHSRVEDVHFNVKLHVLPSITSPLPTQAFNPDKFVIPAYVQTKLADPGYNKPGNVDMLLGAELFFDIMKTDKHVISEQASFQSTVFGWILTGQVVTNCHQSVSNPVMCNSSALSLFITTSARDRAEEEEVERHFKSTVVRTETGRFMVRLPLKLHPEVIGSTIFMAKRRFFNLEAKLLKNAVLAKQYDDFMLEYIKLGHMQPVTSSSSSKVSHYLPHHAVIKDNSITTKLRVVFDASATGSSGMSLNNIMLKGPTVQPTLHSILLRFRTHTFALTADIEKMYRQILVHPDDCELQRILYRSSPSETLKEYTLRTVTYGTKSAPYLATRCLSQLGSEACRSNTQRTIRDDFYVDDLLSGGESIEDCLNLYNDISNTLLSAGMSLRKWCTNSNVLSNQLATSEQDPNYLLKLHENDTVSTLGVTWNPHADCFQFIVRDWKPPIHMSKRSLLADINKVYDPLGFISPVLVKGKIFVQQLWLLKLGWDTRLPKELQNKWLNFYGELSALEALRIPRRVMYSHERIELHGFSDASQEAYGACVYVKTTDDHGQVSVLLYTSKSRVAPTKQTTIPRLELCGAVLLMEIMVDVVDELTRMDIQVNQSNVMLWTDSTIVLAWIKSNQLLKSYVANRVARILDHSVQSQWKHVPTNQNPADIISRGTTAMGIKTNMLWWTGPQWLLRPRVDWPSRETADDEAIPEVRCIKLALVAVSASNTVLDRYSEWNSLIRTTGWLLRFSHNAKATKIIRLPNRYGPLTVTELAKAQTVWLQYVQSIEFKEELTALRKGKPVSSKSRLKSLNPFIDQDDLVRVGGRLSLSNLSDQRKFPIVLPSRHKITRMIFEHEHKRLLHAGPQALLASIHTRFWPLRGRDTARFTVHKCITCFRHHPTTLTPYMAPLPRQRTSIERPFTHTGVDFCGPISVRSGIRRVTSTKAYISVFVCFSTRAIHLELVNGLTSNAFIAALKRFVGRRGSPQHMYSDNGTNFVGANKELRAYIQQLHKDYHLDKSIKLSGIQWHFNPPATPHFGGLWESAVKSTKTHLVKCTKGALFTFEELSTLLCQVEAVLNSRPMTSLSTDPSDYSALTPAHFLIGSPLTQVLEPTMSTEPRNKLKRWELVRFQSQHFWNRWSREYLPQLQKRGRWLSLSRPVKVGDLAISKEDNQPARQWKLVRIIAVHPGPDGITRVVTIKNSAGKEYQRPVVKLAVLPTSVDEDNEHEDTII